MLDNLVAVVCVKRPVPGRVKTRLVEDGGLDGPAAAGVGLAMLRCTVQRLAARGATVVLAVTPDGDGPRLLADLEEGDLPVVDQGRGDLGRRLDRAWRAVRPDGPLAFFGMDCPDVPDEALAAILPALRSADAAVGPTDDGGYWTLAGSRHLPALLARIDWGSEAVYDQTVERATEAGLSLRSLPAWPDVDVPEDLRNLRRRLARALPRQSDEPLRRLAGRLDSLCR